MKDQTNLNPQITTLNQFTKPAVLQNIGPLRVAKFLDGFADDLKAANITLPTPESVNGDYLHSVAALLASSALLPDRLRVALLTLEVAASPENDARLDTAIQHRIPCVSLNRNCPLDCALELWFAAPDELSQFAPPVPPVGPLPSAGDPESGIAVVQPQIGIENPKIDSQRGSLSLRERLG